MMDCNETLSPIEPNETPQRYDPRNFTRWGGWLTDILTIQKPEDTPDSQYLETLLGKLDVLNHVRDFKGIVPGVLAFTQKDLNYLCSDLLDGLWKGVTNLNKGQDLPDVRFRAGRPTSVVTFLKRCIHFPSVFAYLKAQGVSIEDRAQKPAKNLFPSADGIIADHSVSPYSVWVSKAVSAGALATLEWLWDQGGVLMTPGALNQAALCGYLHVFKFLHSKGVDLTVDNEAPLMWACDYNQLETARFLLEITAGPQDPNLWAQRLNPIVGVSIAINGVPQVGQAFRLIDPTQRHWPQQQPTPEIAENRGYCLIRGIEKGHLSIVKLLLEYGANPNLPSDPVQRHLFKSSQFVYLELLLRYGMVVRFGHFELALITAAQESIQRVSEEDGKQEKGKEDGKQEDKPLEQGPLVINRLLDLGFSVNENGGALLTEALRAKNLPLIRLLFEYGAHTILTQRQQSLLMKSTPEIQDYLEGTIMSRRSMDQ